MALLRAITLTRSGQWTLRLRMRLCGVLVWSAMHWQSCACNVRYAGSSGCSNPLAMHAAWQRTSGAWLWTTRHLDVSSRASLTHVCTGTKRGILGLSSLQCKLRGRATRASSAWEGSQWEAAAEANTQLAAAARWQDDVIRSLDAEA